MWEVFYEWVVVGCISFEIEVENEYDLWDNKFVSIIYFYEKSVY